nr:EOG090X08SX [Sida crystallina]
MLLPLVQSYGDKCSVHLYHTPSLNGILKSVLPQRWDEIVGLQHMKLYLFDDSVLISGANLSNDYFTNRQDRYLLIEDSKNLADFCDQLVQTVSRFSFKLDKSNNLELDSQWGHHPFLNSSTDFVAEARKTVLSLYEKQRSSQNNDESFRWPNDKSHDTWIFPLVQMGQLNVDMDNICTRKILECIPTDAEMSLATGYFNLTQDYMTSILQTCRADVQILMAHPSANGFLGASGFAGGIPSAYTLLASQFYRQVIDTSQDLRIRLWEYRRLGWTFHAKGLWMSFTGNDTRPCFTLIGSPNFGK